MFVEHLLSRYLNSDLQISEYFSGTSLSTALFSTQNVMWNANSSDRPRNPERFSGRTSVFNSSTSSEIKRTGTFTWCDWRSMLSSYSLVNVGNIIVSVTPEALPGSAQSPDHPSSALVECSAYRRISATHHSGYVLKRTFAGWCRHHTLLLFSSELFCSFYGHKPAPVQSFSYIRFEWVLNFVASTHFSGRTFTYM